MYEVGDKVIYQGADKNAYKKVGVLKSIEEKDGKPQLTVEFEGGETFTAPIDDWSKEFTNAATNAKFKVGDRVRVIGHPELEGTKGTVWKIKPNGQVGITTGYDMQGHPFDEWVHESFLVKAANACRSTNSVVRNAMAANRRIARNAKFNQYSSDKDFGNGIECLVEDKNGVIKTSVRAGHGGSYVTGSAAEIKSWMRSEEAKLKAIFDAVNKAVAFASKWDGKPTESYDA